MTDVSMRPWRLLTPKQQAERVAEVKADHFNRVNVITCACSWCKVERGETP